MEHEREMLDLAGHLLEMLEAAFLPTMKVEHHHNNGPPPQNGAQPPQNEAPPPQNGAPPPPPPPTVPRPPPPQNGAASANRIIRVNAFEKNNEIKTPDLRISNNDRDKLNKINNINNLRI